jgi:hypothetical protein
MGFFELRSAGIPSVDWKIFTRDTVLDRGLLWTIRVAVESGNDTNLPRLVGACADEAGKKGRELLNRFAGNGMVVYYPYFIAEKSGIIDVNNERTIIEAVDKDLWNLVTSGMKDVTAIIRNPGSNGSSSSNSPSVEIIGNRDFLSQYELKELMRCADIIKGSFRDEVNQGKSVIAEWSYAYDTNIANKPVGQRHLVFYELKSV